MTSSSVHLSVKCLFLSSDQQNYIELVYLVYFTLLNFSAVQISHHQVGHEYKIRVGFTLVIPAVGRERPLFVHPCPTMAELDS